MNKIYLLTQTEQRGYDTYDSCVVVARDRDAASKITPASTFMEIEDNWWNQPYDSDTYVSDTWASHPNNVTVRCLGIAGDTLSDGEIICSSFNAG